MTGISGIRTRIILGGREVLRAPEVWTEGRRHTCLGRAGLVLPDPDGTLIKAVAVGDALEIHMGYRDREPAVWSGTVEWIKPKSKDQLSVGAVGESRPLTSMRIIQSWEDESPEAIIAYAVGQAGLTVGRIDSPGVVFPRFVAANATPWQIALQCANTCQRSFGLDMSKWAMWMGADGVNWGDFDEPGTGPVISSAETLIQHRPATDKAALSNIETFLLPGMRHSQRFVLEDARRGVTGDFRALKVRHQVKQNAARTFIEFGEEHGRI
jgi:hypothetical protein